MLFSMGFEAQLAHPTPERERRLILDCVDQAVFAEEMGFDRIWAPEHHSLKWYAHMSAPEVFLTYVAARTSRIRVGHGVVLMPFKYNHPVRVAERAAMLDLLSGGRLDLGAGRGATRQEMTLCDVDPERTYLEVEESLRMIAQMWRTDEFSWDGELAIAPHPILPRPVQLPHPPLFMACSKVDTVRLAAEYGVGALVLGFDGIDEIREYHDAYREACASRTGERFVSDQVNDHFSALLPTIVLDDAEEAFRIGARGQRFFAESLAHWYGGGPPPAQDTEDVDNIAEIAAARDRVVAKLHEANVPVTPKALSTFNIDHAYGSADHAAGFVERLRDVGVDEVMLMIQMGTVPQDVCMETIRQWGTKIIPRFR
ncbi:MAG: LLM class flavin-dependent oxidoreductase [Streptomycetaceae bacterium]|jgi:alkanesulfonate monooxygenase SsuD/methylene tetrahydromethanopterin reductase-like flavin-dependent oxidoreductase (luciferase family)|nr:LLM class flavin-dependent oxidoreductase [Streptomycetaceae bacterium]